MVRLSRDTGIEYVTLGRYLRVNETCRYPWSTGVLSIWQSALNLLSTKPGKRWDGQSTREASVVLVALMRPLYRRGSRHHLELCLA